MPDSQNQGVAEGNTGRSTLVSLGGVTDLDAGAAT